MTNNAKATLLFVDDEKNILEISREYFQHMGYTVLTADNGFEALDTINNQSVDCCVTDINMPSMDGLELAGRIRQIDNTIPVVIITGHPTLDNAIQTMKNGVVDFLVKPVSLKQMALCVRRVLRERRLFAENLLLKNELEGKKRLEKLNRELLSKIDELGVMNKIMRDFESIRSTSDVFRQAVELGGEITPAEELKFYVVNDAFAEPLEVACYVDAQMDSGDHDPERNRVFDAGDLKIASGSVNRNEGELSLKRFITEALSDEIPLLIPDNHRHTISGLPRSIRSFLMVPLKIREKIFGILTAMIKTRNRCFNERDLYYLMTMSQKAALAIENLVLYDNIYDNLISTLSAFVTAVEARDSYTHQHSNRVTDIALLIGRELDISKEDLDVLNFAGRLHDIGKIGIRDDILLKPGRLTDDEFEKIKGHPVIGANIVGQLGLWDREQKIIRYHHERFDGSGYPEGLAGNQIPLLARVLSVADAYDAMASDRAYRKKMEADIILKNIYEGAGTQFDPQVTDAFLKLYDEGKVDDLGKSHS